MNENKTNTILNTQLHMTADVWNAIVEMMNVGQLTNFIENLNFIQDRLMSDEVITNCVDDFGGADRVLLLLNTFKRMSNLFETINLAIESRGEMR